VAHLLPTIKSQCANLPAPPSFVTALRRETLAIIAEIKRASPSKGHIAPGLNAREQAEAYKRGGAAAISVLTEPDEFGGSHDDLADVARHVSLPVLRKDFIVHAVQIWEARAAGAAAVLLIARSLSPTELPTLYKEARNAGLDVLVEVRDAQEMQRAIDVGARVIGVNNRNLETLVIDPATAPQLMHLVPVDRIAVAESGMASTQDAIPAQQAGADALLIGSAISAAADPTKAVASFAELVRVSRG
jgi:indole-3-glycerol phosphate synthase